MVKFGTVIYYWIMVLFIEGIQNLAIFKIVPFVKTHISTTLQGSVLG